MLGSLVLPSSFLSLHGAWPAMASGQLIPTLCQRFHSGQGQGQVTAWKRQSFHSDQSPQPSYRYSQGLAVPGLCTRDSQTCSREHRSQERCSDRRVVWRNELGTLSPDPGPVCRRRRPPCAVASQAPKSASLFPGFPSFPGSPGPGALCSVTCV